MALLQVRNGVSTLLTLGVWLLSVIICTGPLSVDAFFASPDKTPGPDPRIRIVIHPPDHVIIPSNNSVFLNCSANYTADQYQDDEYMDDDYGTYMGDNVDRPSYEQNDEPAKEDEHLLKQNDGSECQSDILYQWFRNGQPVGKTNDSNYQIFCNGTIKITHSPTATAIYRCMARTKHPMIGSVISKSCDVQAAVFDRIPNSKSESNAELGSSIVINCPIDSVPKMDVIWSHVNGSDIRFAAAERYFQLNNGSLLIVNIKNEDEKLFRCTARNKYFKSPKLVRHSLKVTDAKTTKNTIFLPKLQNDTVLIRNGSALRLYCATSTGNSIHWTFTLRNSTTSDIPLAVQKPNELRIDSTSVQEHDGLYKCWSGNEYQSFDVTIATPPVILNDFTSKEVSLGYYIQFNCNVTGNPKPTIEWYHNGELIHYDWIVIYKEPKLLIQTFEEEHKGIYQCVAKNPLGEVHATGLLSLKQKSYIDPPKNVKCFPINLTSYKVTFDSPGNFKWSGVTYYTASRTEPNWQTDHLYDLNKRIQDEFIIKNAKRLPFEPFMLYFRGMENTGSDMKQKSGVISHQFDLSRLSEGVKCAIQGLQVYGKFSQEGIFIWWPKVDYVNVTSYLIQFRSNDPINFDKDVIGTTKAIDEFQKWKDIADHLTIVPAVTNIHPQPEIDESESEVKNKNRTRSNKLITELRVGGNVTGILIPNTLEIVVRILIPISDEDGELIQDTRFVEWKKIRNKPGRETKFQLVNKGAHHVTFFTVDPSLRCVRVCYQSDEGICDEKSIDHQHVEVDGLSAFKEYNIILSECGSAKTPYNEFTIQTDHDIPGAVMNHKIFKKDGIVLQWNTPVNPNGHLEYYLIEWTVANQTHSAKIPYRSDANRNVFKFPNIQESDRFNVTIRAVSNFGHGNPIYINLQDVVDIPYEDSMSNVPERQDPRLGIAIGALLSLLCIVVCMLIIIKHRKCMKAPRQNVDVNNGVGRSSFQNRSGTDRSTNGTTIFTSSSTQITANCTLDGHEMQTLILSSSVENITSTNGNGITKIYEHQSNGGVILRSNGGPSYCDANDADSDDEGNTQDMSRCGLISSTPKTIHKAIICRNSSSNDLDDEGNTVTRISVYSIQDDLEMHQSNDELMNESLKSLLKTKLPQTNSSHSIDRDESPPTIKRIINKTNVSSPLDESQRNLLRKASTNGSSASTSSGLNVDSSSNSISAPLDHHQSHLYLFNEKDMNNDN